MGQFFLGVFLIVSMFVNAHIAYNDMSNDKSLDTTGVNDGERFRVARNAAQEPLEEFYEDKNKREKLEEEAEILLSEKNSPRSSFHADPTEKLITVEQENAQSNEYDYYNGYGY